MNKAYVPVDEYENRKKKYQKLFDNNKKKLNNISWLRFFVFLALCFSIFNVLADTSSYWWFICIIVMFFIFIVLVVKSGNIKKEIKLYSDLCNINTRSIKRVSGEWNSFPDDGAEFKNYDHRFSFDLDIFGTGSLFQWINVTNTPHGRIKLKEILSNPIRKIEIIRERQKGISELASRLSWRQNFQAMGINLKEKFKDPIGLLSWAEDGNRILKGKFFVFFIRSSPIVTFLLIGFIIFFSTMPKSFSLLPLLVQLAFIFFYSGRVNNLFKLAGSYKDDIRLYKGLLEIIENEKFKTKYLNELKSTLLHKNFKASGIINRLENIVDYMNLRFSSIHFFINLLTFWDFQCVVALEKWKENAGGKIRQWLDIIGEFESLSSLSNIPCDNPSWEYPEITEKKYLFQSKNMGHPLISSNNRIHNDLLLHGAGNTLIITGSNMSGKSTMLRTVGINLLLAYAGAPVCAESMKCSIMNIYSSMRINDNLEKSISSFYAELIRIKMILEASVNDEPVIFFLDEVFRGTNSKERKAGAEIVLKKLWGNNALGLVATHDLELAELSFDKKYNFENYYFMETYDNNKIHFDYKIRKGISNTTDAIFLMRMIGIDIDD